MSVLWTLFLVNWTPGDSICSALFRDSEEGEIMEKVSWKKGDKPNWSQWKESHQWPIYAVLNWPASLFFQRIQITIRRIMSNYAAIYSSRKDLTVSWITHRIVAQAWISPEGKGFLPEALSTYIVQYQDNRLHKHCSSACSPNRLLQQLQGADKLNQHLAFKM